MDIKQWTSFRTISDIYRIMGLLHILLHTMKWENVRLQTAGKKCIRAFSLFLLKNCVIFVLLHCSIKNKTNHRHYFMLVFFPLFISPRFVIIFEFPARHISTPFVFWQHQQKYKTKRLKSEKTMDPNSTSSGVITLNKDNLYQVALSHQDKALSDLDILIQETWQQKMERGDCFRYKMKHPQVVWKCSKLSRVVLILGDKWYSYYKLLQIS